MLIVVCDVRISLINGRALADPERAAKVVISSTDKYCDSVDIQVDGSRIYTVEASALKKAIDNCTNK